MLVVGILDVISCTLVRSPELGVLFSHNAVWPLSFLSKPRSGLAIDGCANVDIIQF